MNVLASKHLRQPNMSASSLLCALLTMAILSFVAATVIAKIGTRYHSTFHSSSWEEALLAAETGADLAMLSVNKVEKDVANAWAGWSGPDANGVRSIAYGPTSNPPLTPHLGEGNRKLHASVEVDAMISGRRTWYRIRSRGNAELSGPARTGVEGALRDESGTKNIRSVLRKLSFQTDRTSGALRVPQVSRRIEIMAQQVSTSLFMRALTVKDDVRLSSNVVIDSYDSSDPAKSTSGMYDPAKRQSNGDVASNSSGDLSNLASAAVYGDALSNGGTMSNTTGVSGQIYNNFSTEFPTVEKPVWSYLSPGPASVEGTTILNAGSNSRPTHYKLTCISLQSSQSLTLRNPTPGQDAYVEVWVTGDISNAGQSVIILDPGVRATIHAEGSVHIAGGGIINTGKPEALVFKGITPEDPASSKDFTYSGQAAFTGVVYAPSFVLDLNGQGAVTGAAVGKRCTLGGQGTFHYDESLSKLDIGGTGGYQVASWVEDVR